MRSSRIRSPLLTAVLVAFCGLGWFYLAPTQIGGSTHYVITHGISMEPMLHTGDLAIVRPQSDYRVGQVVAYHSTLLHTVVLHRIVRIAGGHYTFKGDNNSFLDPTHPTRSMLIGAMWVHIPHGGDVVNFIHKPWVAAALTGGVAMLLLLGGDQRRRRRRRGRQPSARSKSQARGPNPVSNRQLLAASAVVAALFAGLGVYAFTRPTISTSTSSVPYTQQVRFGYSAHVRPGPAYPNGVVTTGDPLYTPLVHRLRVTASYRLSSSTSYKLTGSVRLRGTVANSSGWSRGLWLGPAAPITAGRGVATADISLPRFNSLITRVSTQIGLGAGTYTLAIVPQLSLKGRVGGQPLASAGQPTLSLALGGPQLLVGTSAGTSTGAATSGSSLAHTTNGEVTTAHTAVEKLGPVQIKTVRLIGIGGFVLFALISLLLASREHGATRDPAERINARYKHLIVPVSSITTDPEHPPIEVRTIEALAQLAERSERLILHDHHDGVDDYLIDDQGTLFRFQALRARDTNGNGNGNTTRGEEPAKVAAAVAAGSEHADLSGVRTSPRPEPRAAPQPEPRAAPQPEPRVAPQAEPELRAAPRQGPEPAAQARASAGAAAAEQAPPISHVHGFAPLSDPVESAEAIRLSSRVTPVIPGPQPRRPPVRNYGHWSQRPEIRIGLTIAPLLTLLALRRGRTRRAEKRAAEVDERRFSAADEPRATGSAAQWATGDRRRPQRAPGDRRRGDRRRNG